MTYNNEILALKEWIDSLESEQEKIEVRLWTELESEYWKNIQSI